jgi:PAS domain S-box-containing protein
MKKVNHVMHSDSEKLSDAQLLQLRISAAGQILAINIPARKWFGDSLAKLRGKKLDTLVAPAQARIISDLLNQVKPEMQPFNIDLQLPDGKKLKFICNNDEINHDFVLTSNTRQITPPDDLNFTRIIQKAQLAIFRVREAALLLQTVLQEIAAISPDYEAELFQLNSIGIFRWTVSPDRKNIIRNSLPKSDPLTQLLEVRNRPEQGISSGNHSHSRFYSFFPASTENDSVYVLTLSSKTPIIFTTVQTELLQETSQSLIAALQKSSAMSHGDRYSSVVQQIASTVTGLTGKKYLESVALGMASILKSSHLLISKLSETDSDWVDTIAYVKAGKLQPQISYNLSGTPCEQVTKKSMCTFSSDVAGLFPEDTMLREENIESYVGLPLINSNNEIIAIISAMFDEPLTDAVFYESVIRIFASRTAAEIERMQIEQRSVQNEQQIQALVANTPGILLLLSPELDFRFINQLPHQDDTAKLIGTQFLKVLRAAQRPSIRKLLKSILKTGQQVEFEMEYQPDSSGHSIWLSAQAGPMYEGDEITALVITAMDISHRRETEGALRQSEQSYRGLFNNAGDAIYILDHNGTFIDVNDAAVKMYNYPREMLIGKSPAFVSPPGYNNLEEVGEMVKQAFTGIPQKFEFWGLASDGRIFPKEVRLTHGNYFGKDVVIAFAQDITVRKRHELIQEIMRNISEAVHITTSSTAFYRVIEKELSKIINTRNFLIGLYNKERHSFSVLLMQDEKDSFVEFPAQKTISALVIRENRSLILNSHDMDALEASGEISLVGSPSKSWMGVPLRVNTEVLGLLVMQDYHRENAFSDTDRELIEFIANQIAILIRRKQDQEEINRLYSSIEQSPVSVVITNIDGRIEYVNPKVLDATGYTSDEIIGNNPRMFSSGKASPDLYKDLWTSIRAGKVWHGEFYNRKKSGAEFIESATISPIKNQEGEITHIIAVKEDITERRVLQEQLVLAQKMQGLGQLAGGISHDFNNILTVMRGFAELSLREIDPKSRLFRHLSNILAAGERAGKLVQQLLAFSRKQLIDPEILDLNKLITELNRILRRLIGEDIHINLDLEEELPAIQADPAQIEQIIVNLLVNARDAINDNSDKSAERTISIETSCEFIDEKQGIVLGNLSPGEYVILFVSDTGTGMSEEILNRIFDPFFSTKEMGKGTGLGLSTVYGIVKQNNGHITVDSHPGHGTTFAIYWQASRQSGKDQHNAVNSETLADGRETILFVEDDPDVMDFATDALSDLGYNIIKAQNGRKALEIIRAQKDRIDLVITDVIMPEMGGIELAENIRTEMPEMKMIFSSGYTSNYQFSKEILAHSGGLLNKPYSLEDLASRVRTTLDV